MRCCASHQLDRALNVSLCYEIVSLAHYDFYKIKDRVRDKCNHVKSWYDLTVPLHGGTGLSYNIYYG
jgi:hypothetical protein